MVLKGIAAGAIAGTLVLGLVLAVVSQSRPSAQMLDQYVISQRTMDRDGRHIIVSTAQNPVTTPVHTTVATDVSPSAPTFDESPRTFIVHGNLGSSKTVSKTVVMQHLQDEVNKLMAAQNKKLVVAPAAPTKTIRIFHHDEPGKVQVATVHHVPLGQHGTFTVVHHDQSKVATVPDITHGRLTVQTAEAHPVANGNTDVNVALRSGRTWGLTGSAPVVAALPQPPAADPIKIEMITPAPPPLPTGVPSKSPATELPSGKPETVISTITDNKVVEQGNGQISNTTTVVTRRDIATLITDPPTNLTIPVPAPLTMAPQPKFVINVITDTTPVPTAVPTEATPVPVIGPSPAPVVPATGAPTYKPGTYVVNLDVSGLPKDHGPVAVPVAMPDGSHTVVQIPGTG